MVQLELLSDNPQTHYNLYTEHTFQESLKPIPNPFNEATGFDYGDGSCLMSKIDMHRYIRENNVRSDFIWTVLLSNGSPIILNGIRSGGVLGYLITKCTPFDPLEYSIPTQH